MMLKIFTLSIFAFFHFLSAFCAEEKFNHKFSGENYIYEIDDIFHYKASFEIPYTLTDKSRLGKTSQPFRGVLHTSKKAGYTISKKWLDDKVKDILDYYKKKKTPENLYIIKSRSDIWKSFACKAFLDILSSNLKNDGTYENEDTISKAIKEEYIKTGLMYMMKYNNQLSVKKPPRFGSIKKYIQPLMASFIYCNPWLVISEIYESSKGFSNKGQRIYIDYFLDDATMTIMRRRFTFPFKDNNIIWSILNMEKDVFVSYTLETTRKWLEDRQYRASKFETKTKVSEIPEAFRGAQIRNHMP